MSAKKSRLFRTTEPPDTTRVARLVVVRPGRAHKYLCCSEKVHGFQTHWDPKTKRTVECTEPTKLCRGHAAGMPVRWKGIISVITDFGQEPILLDLPPEAGAKLIQDAKGQSLKGKVLLCQRETSNIRSRLLIDVLHDYAGDESFPDEVDPEPTLMKLWGIKFS